MVKNSIIKNAECYKLTIDPCAWPAFSFATLKSSSILGRVSASDRKQLSTRLRKSSEYLAEIGGGGLPSMISLRAENMSVPWIA